MAEIKFGACEWAFPCWRVSAVRMAHEAGFDGVLMSGSGSTVFGITKDKELVEKTMEKLKKQRYFVRHTNILV